MRVMITGVAGFIGFHLANYLIDRGDEVIGVDCLNELVYPNEMKDERLKILAKRRGFHFWFSRIGECPKQAFWEIDTVCHLAANAGVRSSLENPVEYVQENVVEFCKLLEKCRHRTKNFVFASSSSVYGNLDVYPSSEDMKIDRPISVYAATKAADELIAHTYSHLYNIPMTGLRFFTVYGPWGRPDMALLIFIKNILEDKPIKVFNHGDMYRDFTYIDDIIEGIVKCIDNPQKFEIFNIGRGKPEKLMDFVRIIEECCGKKAEIISYKMQPGDVQKSFADISKLNKIHNYIPEVNISEGIPKTVEWYKKHVFNINGKL